MTSQLVQLRDLLSEVRNGLDAEQNDRPIAEDMLPISRIETISEGIVDLTRVKYARVTEGDRRKYQLRRGDILFSHINSPEHIGKTAIFDDDRPLIHGINLLLLRVDRGRCNPEYLNYYLKSSDVRARFRTRCKKAVNQASLNQSDILSLAVPVPPLLQQERVAVILQRVDKLRRTRRYAKQLSDSFLSSVFLTMFGDPVKNPMRWKKTRVADLGDVQTGNTPPRTETQYYGNDIEWIKSDNILHGQMYVQKGKEMLSARGMKVARAVREGSILVTCIAGSPTSIGNVAITDRTVAFNQQINSVTPKPDVHPLFLYGLFLVAKPLVQRSTTLGMKRIITKSKFESLLLIKPPFQLQERFAQVVQRYERLSAQQREAECQAEHLFQTLLHLAFQGAL